MRQHDASAAPAQAVLLETELPEGRRGGGQWIGRGMADPRAWGIEPGYHDVHGDWHDAPSETVDAFLEVMGANAETPPGLGDDNPVWVVREDETVRAEGRWELETEGGAT